MGCTELNATRAIVIGMSDTQLDNEIASLKIQFATKTGHSFSKSQIDQKWTFKAFHYCALKQENLCNNVHGFYVMLRNTQSFAVTARKKQNSSSSPLRLFPETTAKIPFKRVCTKSSFVMCDNHLYKVTAF